MQTMLSAQGFLAMKPTLEQAERAYARASARQTELRSRDLRCVRRARAQRFAKLHLANRVQWEVTPKLMRSFQTERSL
jgi:hypothetical protein